jgi:hypothetical protein
MFSLYGRNPMTVKFSPCKVLLNFSVMLFPKEALNRNITLGKQFVLVVTSSNMDLRFSCEIQTTEKDRTIVFTSCLISSS